MTAEQEARFTDKVQPEPMTGCWLWVGCTTRFGYGMVSQAGKMKLAHRVSYEHRKGPIPAGLVIDHLCRVRPCVNPDHLRVVTGRENTLDARSLNFARVNADKTACTRGHAYAGRNVILYRGSRYCRECMRGRSRDYMRRKRAEGSHGEQQ